MRSSFSFVYTLFVNRSHWTLFTCLSRLNLYSLLLFVIFVSMFQLECVVDLVGLVSICNGTLLGDASATHSNNPDRGAPGSFMHMRSIRWFIDRFGYLPTATPETNRKDSSNTEMSWSTEITNALTCLSFWIVRFTRWWLLNRRKIQRPQRRDKGTQSYNAPSQTMGFPLTQI